MTTTINNTTTTNNNVTMNAPASATSAVVNTTINTAAVTPNLKDPDLVDFTLDGAEAQYKAGEYDKLLAQCKQDAANTKWLEEGIRDIRFEASHDEPLCADEYAKQMKVSEEAVLDTQQNAGLNLTTCIGKKPVGDSAVRSICDRGMIGMNCYELLRKERRESLKEVLNLILAERKGAVQIKYSYDKVRAVHSARYAAIGNDKLLKIMVRVVIKRNVYPGRRNMQSAAEVRVIVIVVIVRTCRCRFCLLLGLCFFFLFFFGILFFLDVLQLVIDFLNRSLNIKSLTDGC